MVDSFQSDIGTMGIGFEVPLFLFLKCTVPEGPWFFSKLSHPSVLV